ncbi:hypothetical protein QCA50_001875 [Cerrena zonata]|uniref:LAGLIDADG homing endonuclease n=1 Tax=Cerrena zonata TaxID=2478898 RepID=A0AAW0GPV5_9APHY
MRQRANSSTRPQFDAHPPFTPEHLFVALDNTGELRIEGIAFQQLIDELREQVIPMWPHGVIVEDSRDHRWRVQFAGRPWTSSHEDGLFARRLLSQLFLVLNRQGYSYLTTVNTSGTPCRLLFSGGEIPADGPEVYFFNICFSQSGDKISIVDAPPQLVQHLGRSLRSVFPNKIESDTYKEGNVYTIRMKRGLGGSDVDKTLLAAYVLKFWKEMGYELNGSLPLGRRLNLGAKKEVWMFRGAMPRPPSAHSHR